jgi:hypothetical protein
MGTQNRGVCVVVVTRWPASDQSCCTCLCMFVSLYAGYELQLCTIIVLSTHGGVTGGSAMSGVRW